MTERRVPPKRRGRTPSKPSEPLDFKARLAAARSLTEAADDGYLEVEGDDRLDYVDLPMILEKWETKVGWNDKVHCRVWAVVQVPDKPEPVFIKFRDYYDVMGQQLQEIERASRTFGGVAVMMDAREFQYGPGGLDTGYEFSFRDLNPDGEHVPPPTEEPAADDQPPY